MWFDKFREYGFTPDEDYRELSAKTYTSNGAAHEATDYEITVDMAKELAMLQKTEKGKQARQYFIQLEKQWNSPEAIMARALKVADMKMLEYKNKVISLQSKLEEQKPLVSFAETCLKSKDNILVRQLAKIAQDEGIKDIGEKKLYNKLRDWKMIMPYNTEPYQSAMNAGYFVVDQKSIDTPYGIKLTRTTKVTPKGQVYIVERLKREKDELAS